MPKLSSLKDSAWKNLVIRLLPWFLISPLFLVPLSSSLGAMFSSGSSEAPRLFELWLSPSVAKSLRFSLIQAACSALLSLVLGLPGAWLLARYRFAGRKFFVALSGMPFVFPPVLFTLGYIQAWGRNGLINKFLQILFHLDTIPLDIAYSFWSVVFAHSLFNFPLVLGIVSAVWLKNSGKQEDAARSLGAGEIRIFFTITLPSLLPGIISAFSLIFVYCFMSFAIPLSLGGGPEFATLEVSIFAAVNGQQDFVKGGAIALLELLCSLSVLAFWARFRSPGFAETARRELKALSGKSGIFARLYLGLASFLALSPLGALLYSSFVAPGRPGQQHFPSFAAWQKLFARDDLLQSLLNSGLLAFGVGILACLLALILLAGEARQGAKTFRSIFFALPMALSSVILSLGYLRLFPRGASAWVLLLLQATAAYPLAYRSLRAARSRISKNLDDAAALLGASSIRIWFTLDLPLMRKALFSSFALCAALSLGEINAALMLNIPQFPLLGISAYRLMGSYQYPSASALGVLIGLLAALAFAFADFMGDEA